MSARIILWSAIIMAAVCGTPLMADSVLDDVQVVFGPRVGFSYVFMESEAFTNSINEIPWYNGESYFPFTSQFGISIEQRIPLGTTKSHFAFQEVITVGGIDQSIALPTAAVLVGWRADFGLECGIGPMWSLSGFGVIYAAGWTFSYHGVYVPVNVVFVPDFSSGNHSVSIYTGFNFTID